MPRLAYYNGEIMPYESIRIPLTDRSIFFGDAVYDVMIGYNAKVYQFDEHISRLLNGVKALEINLTHSVAQIRDIVNELAKSHADEEFMVYIQVSRASENRTHIYSSSSPSNLMIFTDSVAIRDSLVPISLISQNDLRYEYCNIKTVNLLPSVLAATKANKMSADECVLIRDGIVTECSRSNVVFIRNDTLYAPRESNHILPGITMQNVFEICKKNGIKVRRCDFGYTELISADEILVTSTTKLARRVYKINGIPVGMKQASLAHIISDQLLSKFTNGDC